MSFKKKQGDISFVTGVRHVGGDMFKSIPSGDAIFMKVRYPSLASIASTTTSVPSSESRLTMRSLLSQNQNLRIMQWVLTTWTNDECTTILRNCHAALPDGGKLVACEPVVPEQTDTTTRTRALLENDIFVMTTYRTQGRERSEEEFRHLGVTAFRAIYLDPFDAVLECTK